MTELRERKRATGKRAVIGYVLFGVLLITCIIVFLVFGHKQTIAPKPAAEDATAAPLPSGVPYERFIEALRQSDLGCELGEAELLGENTLRYELITENRNDTGAVLITTDAYGRVAEAKLIVGYMQPEYTDYEVGSRVEEGIEAEIRRRTEFDEKLINAYLDAFFGVFGSDYGIGSIDQSKFPPAIISAYESAETYEKKAGKARFFCETKPFENDAEFDLTIQLTQPK